MVDRSLTDEEQELARWMLENGTSDAASFLTQLDNARVVRLCGCGCASIDFKIEGHEIPSGGLHILGDFLFGEGDDTAGAFIFAKEGLLSGLEVFSYGVRDRIENLPQPAQLRPVE